MRRLALLAALLVFPAVVACSPGANTATPTGDSAALKATVASTNVASPSNTPPANTPQSGTEIAPSKTAQAQTPPPFIPAAHFVDNADCQDLNREQLPLADVVISDGTRQAAFTAEMAMPSAEKSQGLMCRETVEGGMLFIWDVERTGGFWMFNTYAPLDILFFGAQDGSAAFKQMDPCPRDDGEADAVWNSRCAAESADYRHATPYTTALELPQGWLESLGFDTANPEKIIVSFSARS